MAQPLAFAEANLILYPPEGMEDDVMPLHVRATDCSAVSCWKLSEKELAEIQRTGVVWLSVMGGRMPPVMVSGQKADMV